MEVLKWITDNWVNILAFMGALNLLAQTLTRANKNGAKGDLADKTIRGLKAAASLGMHPPEESDSLPPHV